MDHEKRFDDETPDKTPYFNVVLSYQQIYMIYDVMVDFNEEEKSTKLTKILDTLHSFLERNKNCIEVPK